MRQPRHLLVPNANSPDLLVRLLELVSQGRRTTRELAEALEVESRTVGYYTQAGQWLGLLDVDHEPGLTPLGLELVYAGPERDQVYARAVWANPVVAELLAESDDALPSVAAVSRKLHELDPDMAESTVRRRATAVRGLIAPAIGTRRVTPLEEARQMALPLGLPAAPATRQRLETVGSHERSAEAYRFLLASLLDHGELQLRHVRGLLDRAGADRAPLGGYLEMAVERGDALRIDDVLVATLAATRRPELVESAQGIMLSDRPYRAYLDEVARGSSERAAEVRRGELARRFRRWDRKLFGGPAPEDVEERLASVVLDRPLSAFPLAVAGIEPDPVEPGPFLERWEAGAIRVACPPTLAHLQGGVAAVNRLLREVRMHPENARIPGVADPATRVHGGLLHPGEVPPRAVPDTRSLRSRVLMNVPYVALLTAVLLVHRQRPNRLVLHRSRGRWRLRWDDAPAGPILPFLDAFGLSRGWVVSRRASGGLPDASLFDGLEALGILSVFGHQAVLSEKFFGQLRTAPEESEVHARLLPLAHALEHFLEGGQGWTSSSTAP